MSQTTVNDTVAQIEPSSTRSAIELRLGATRRNRLGEDCKRASHGVRTPRTIAVRERVINGHVSVASDGNKCTYIHSTSDHKFLPNGTRRRPQIVVVDHVLVRWSPPGQTTATMPYDAFQHERTAITDQAAYSKAHLPATTQTHRNTRAQL